MMQTTTRRAAMVLARNFEDIEATSPKEFLEAAGVPVTVIGLDKNEIVGKKGTHIAPDTSFADLTPEDRANFDVLVIPGGGSPENLRIDDAAVDFTRAVFELGRPVAAICHGPQLLISAKVLEGFTLTCVNKIRDDVINAGATYLDEPVVVDRHLITSRTPADLDVFNQAIATALHLSPAPAGA